MREFFEQRDERLGRPPERWREGLAAEQQEALPASTRRPSTALEREDYHCAPAAAPGLRAPARVSGAAGAGAESAGAAIQRAATSSSSAAPGAPAPMRWPSSSAATAPRRRPDRGPLPLQQARHAGPARRPDHARRLPREAARLLVAPGPRRRPAARPLQPDAASRVRRRRWSASRPPTRTTRGRLPAASSATCSGRSPSGAGKPGLVEMSSHNVRAAADAAAGCSRRPASCTPCATGATPPPRSTGKTWGPRQVGAAIGWWADRLRAIEDGVRGSEDGAAYSIPADRFRVVVLDDLVGWRARAHLRGSARVPRHRRRAGDARVLRRRDDRRGSPPRPLAPGARARPGVPLVQRRYDGRSRRSSARATTRRRCSGRRSTARPRGPAGERPAARRGGGPRILFATSNGTGLGHLTRAMAIARRLPAGHSSPSFFTLSAAAPVVAARASRSSTWPPTGAPGAGTDWRWSLRLRRGSSRSIAEREPDLVVFDGVHPYRALTHAAQRPRRAAVVWCRRPMWRPGRDRAPLRRIGAFDAVLEPGELAEADDRGPTVAAAPRGPPGRADRLLDRDELLPRAQAAAELGLDPGPPHRARRQLGQGGELDVPSPAPSSR